jgi:hypothetical protein
MQILYSMNILVFISAMRMPHTGGAVSMRKDYREGAGKDDESGGTEVKDYIKINHRFYIHLVTLLFRKQPLIKNVCIFDNIGLKYYFYF